MHKKHKSTLYGLHIFSNFWPGNEGGKLTNSFSKIIRVHKFLRFQRNTVLIDSCTFTIRLFVRSFRVPSSSFDLHVIKIQNDHYGVMREMQRFSSMVLSVRTPLRNAMV